MLFAGPSLLRPPNHAGFNAYIPVREDRLISLSTLNDLVFPKAPQALAEHLTHSDHYDDIDDDLKQTLGRQNKNQ